MGSCCLVGRGGGTAGGVSSLGAGACGLEGRGGGGAGAVGCSAIS